MSDESKPEKSPSKGVYLVYSAAALFLYVLSTGPVAVLAYKFRWSEPAVWILYILYAPIAFLMDYWQPAEDFFVGYVRLCGNLFGTPIP